MQPHMIIVLPELTGYGSIWRIAVSLPYAAQLIDEKKYLMPGDVKPLDGATERRRQGAPCAPSMLTLVRWAQACVTAPSSSASWCEGALTAATAEPRKSQAERLSINGRPLPTLFAAGCRTAHHP